jgi:hypothetical protein
MHRTQVGERPLGHAVAEVGRPAFRTGLTIRSTSPSRMEVVPRPVACLILCIAAAKAALDG